MSRSCWCGLLHASQGDEESVPDGGSGVEVALTCELGEAVPVPGCLVQLMSSAIWVRTSMIYCRTLMMLARMRACQEGRQKEVGVVDLYVCTRVHKVGLVV